MMVYYNDIGTSCCVYIIIFIFNIILTWALLWLINIMIRCNIIWDNNFIFCVIVLYIYFQNLFYGFMAIYVKSIFILNNMHCIEKCSRVFFSVYFQYFLYLLSYSTSLFFISYILYLLLKKMRCKNNIFLMWARDISFSIA